MIRRELELFLFKLCTRKDEHGCHYIKAISYIDLPGLMIPLAYKVPLRPTIQDREWLRQLCMVKYIDMGLGESFFSLTQLGVLCVVVQLIEKNPPLDPRQRLIITEDLMLYGAVQLSAFLR